MEKKIFYRVGTIDNSGMWYNSDGTYNGSMNSIAFNKLSCNKLKMPFCKNTVGYLSVATSIEELENWFSKEDMRILEPLGFKILKYESEDYKFHEINKHWLIKQDTAILMDK